MRNKKLNLVCGFMLAILFSLAGSFASAVNFTLDFGSAGKPARWEFIVKNMTLVHFTDNGNDFGGFIYFANGIVTDEEETSDNWYHVQAGDDVYECQQKVRGFYYNAERGERLWSLDGTYAGVTAEGGLYTRCREQGYADALADCANGGTYKTEAAREECESEVREKYVDSHGYYGMVTHNYNGQKFVLVAGTNYEVNGGSMTIGAELIPSLIRFDNKYPVGFIFDANGGAGFLGCRIRDGYSVQNIRSDFVNNGSDWLNLFEPDENGIKYKFPIKLDCSDMGSAMNSLISVVVDGLVGINRDDSLERNSGIQGNQSNDKMQYFSSVNINNMQLINYARQKAEILCRGKWEKYSGGYSDKSLYCFDRADTVIRAKTGVTIVVKGKDVEVEPMPKNSFDDGGYYDIFIDQGNLLINDGAVTDLTVFKTNGFISEKSLEAFRIAVDEAWNVNDQAYSGDEVVAGKFIKGNFIVNGSINPGRTLNNVYFVYGKLTSKDTVDKLKEVFKWKCNIGTGSDGTPCPGGRLRWNNPYENASLVIIDQNYPSPLYE